MTVAFDAVSTKTDTQSGLTSVSWTHNGAATPSNYLGLVGLSWNGSSNPVSSITWGGTTMTSIVTATAAGYIARLYGLINPPAGTQTLTATYSAATTGEFCYGALSVTGADQTTGWHNTNTNNGSGVLNTLSLVVTSATGEMTVTCFTGDYATTGIASTQTGRYDVTGTIGVEGAGDTAAGAAMVTHTWSRVGNTDLIAIAGLSIIAAAAPTALPIFVQC